MVLFANQDPLGGERPPSYRKLRDVERIVVRQPLNLLSYRAWQNVSIDRATAGAVRLRFFLFYKGLAFPHGSFELRVRLVLREVYVESL